MDLKIITAALNDYLYKLNPNAKGKFIGKEFTEPTSINAYKKFNIEIWYHLPGKNQRAFTTQYVGMLTKDTEDATRRDLYRNFLTLIFENLNTVTSYEAV